MYLRNSKSFIPTQAVPIPRGRPQGRPQGICDPPGCRTFCQVVQSGGFPGRKTPCKYTFELVASKKLTVEGQ